MGEESLKKQRRCHPSLLGQHIVLLYANFLKNCLDEINDQLYNYIFAVMEIFVLLFHIVGYQCVIAMKIQDWNMYTQVLKASSPDKVWFVRNESCQ